MYGHRKEGQHMITVTFGVLVAMLAATASLSGCFGLLIGCLLRAASDKRRKSDKDREVKRM